MGTQAFPFLGGSLVLDFLNTEMRGQHGRIDLLETADDVARWWSQARIMHTDAADRSGSHKAPTNKGILRRVKALRANLRRGFEGIAQHPERLAAVLNHVLASVHPRVDVAANGKMALHFATPGASNMIAPQIALSAMRLIERGELSRIHQCSNDDCILFFHDATKSGTRRWCSTGCFDRARAKERRHTHKIGNS